MEELFYKNPYEKIFNTNIIDVTEQDGEYFVEIDKSYFYYGSGGQTFDKGLIDGTEVFKTIKKDGKIFLVTKKRPLNFKNIICQIDFERRYDAMIQHSAQHLISGIFFNLFGINTVSVHFGDEISTVDIVGGVEESKIKEVEKTANNLIQSGKKIKMYVPSEKEIENINTRRKLPNTEEKIRIVEIENVDMSACSGVHVSNTLEIRMIKIKKFEKYKGNTRIEFLAGERAVCYMLERDEKLTEACNFFSCSENNLMNTITNMSNKNFELNLQIKNLEEEILEYKLEEIISKSKKINDIKVLENFFEMNDKRIGKLILEKLGKKENFIIINLISESDKFGITISVSKNILGIDAANVLSQCLNKFNGKGGGNKFLAQGSIPKNENISQDNIFNEVISIIGAL